MTNCNFVVKNGLSVCGPTTTSGNVTICTGSYLIADGRYITNASGTDQYARNKANSGFDIGGLAYTKANSGFDIGTLAYAKANSGFDIGGLAYSTANSGVGIGTSAFGQANLAYNTANSGVGIGTSAFGQANLAYDTANSGVGIGTSAFGQANLAYAKANSGFDIGGLAYTKANSAYDVATLAYNAANSAGGGGGGSSGPIILTGTSNITDCLTPAATRTLTSTANNIILGMNAGQCVANTQGRNIMLGLYSGLFQCCGNNNVFLGTASGQRAYSGSNDNIFIGQNSGTMASSGNNAIAIGKQAQGYCGSLAPYTICHSVAIGAYSGWKCGSTGSTSTGGVWIGHGAYSPNLCACNSNPISIGDCAASGAYTISIGKCAGVHPSANGNATQSCYSVFIGQCAGYRLTTCNIGSTRFSVFIGSCAGAGICCACCVPYVVAIGAGAGCGVSVGCYGTQIGGSAVACNSGVAVGYNSKTCSSHAVAIGQGAKAQCAGSISIGTVAGGYGYGGACSIAIGRNAAYQCPGACSVAIGLYAGCGSSGTSNVILGNRTKTSGYGGCYSVAIGACAARCLQGFCHSVYIGGYTAYGGYGTYSNYDVIIGARSAGCLNMGGCNTILGAKNGYYGLCGCHNTIIGYCSGKNVTSMGNYICLCCTMLLGSYKTCRMIIPGLGLDTSCATANQVLCWTGTCFGWGTASGGGGASCLICLTDVCLQLATLTDGDFLCWRANANTWVNSSYVAGGGGGGGTAWTQTVGGYYSSGGSYSHYATLNCAFACNLTNNPFSIITLFAQLCLNYWSYNCGPMGYNDYLTPGPELQNCLGQCTLSRTCNACGSYCVTYRHWPACGGGSLTCLGADVVACGSNVYATRYPNSGTPTIVAPWNTRPFNPYMIYGITIDPNWNCCSGAPYLRQDFYCGCMGSGPKVAGYYTNPATTDCGHYGVVAVETCIANLYGSPILACLQARVYSGVCILYACSQVCPYYPTSHFVYKVSNACYQQIASVNNGEIFCSGQWCSGYCWRAWGAFKAS